jgi:hypothetical protein
VWRRCAYWSGVLLIAVAVVAMPSVAVVSSYAGGSAVRGSVEDGRYFVNPGHGRPVGEVSEATWRAVYWVERLWPWSAWVPVLTGLLLTGYGRGPNREPPPVPPAEPPPWVLWACLVTAGLILTGTWLCWVITRTPWAVMLTGWMVICAGGGACAWLYSRALHQQSTAEPSATADPARDIGSPDS